MLYEFYTESVDLDYQIPNYKEMMQFKGYMIFCQNFNLAPSPLSRDEIHNIYRSVTNKQEYYKNVPYAVYLKEFQQTLLRMAIKAGHGFTGSGSNAKQEDGLDSYEYLEKCSVSKKAFDSYEIEAFNPLDLTSLFEYLALPVVKSNKERALVSNILRNFRRENLLLKDKLLLDKQSMNAAAQEKEDNLKVYQSSKKQKVKLNQEAKGVYRSVLKQDKEEERQKQLRIREQELKNEENRRMGNQNMRNRGKITSEHKGVP